MSLSALFDGDQPTGRDNGLDVPDLLERVVIGGWPGLIDTTERDARAWLGDYLRQAVEVDIPSIGPRRNPRNLRRLFESLGRAVGQPVKLTELAKDVGGDRGPIAMETVYSYLDALERLMLTDTSEASRPHMRSSTRLRTAPGRYFVDQSIGPAALGIGSADLLAHLNAAGFHFEALAIRDLRVTPSRSAA